MSLLSRCVWGWGLAEPCLRLVSESPCRRPWPQPPAHATSHDALRGHTQLLVPLHLLCCLSVSTPVWTVCVQQGLIMGTDAQLAPVWLTDAARRGCQSTGRDLTVPIRQVLHTPQAVQTTGPVSAGSAASRPMDMAHRRLVPACPPADIARLAHPAP